MSTDQPSGESAKSKVGPGHPDVDLEIAKSNEFAGLVASGLALNGEVDVSRLQRPPSSQLPEKTINLKRYAETFCEKLRRLREALGQFGALLPDVSYQRGIFRARIRPFVHNLMNPELAFARWLVDQRDPRAPEKYLFPRDPGDVFFGYGATVAQIAYAVLIQQDKPKVPLRFNVTTPNLEVLLAWYQADPPEFSRQNTLRLKTPEAQVDWWTGSLVPLSGRREERHFTTSILGFEQGDSQGQLYCDTADKLVELQSAIDRTTHRVLFIGKASKFGRTGGTKFQLRERPGLDYVVCTDDPLPSNVQLPPYIRHVQLTAPPLAKPSDS